MSIPKCKDFSDYNRYPSDPNPTTDADMQEYMANQNALMKIVAGMLWQPNTNYEVGQQVQSNSLPSGTYAVVVTAGISGGTEPEWGEIDSSVADGSIVWQVKSSEAGGHKIVPAKPSPADAKENVVYFTIENCKAKGYIKNGDVMVEIGNNGDGIPIGTVVSWAGSLDNIPEGFSRYDDTHIVADRDIPSSDMFVTQAKQIAEINTILNPDASGVVYGFRIDNTEADPYASVIYLRDAIGMEPAYMDYTRGRFDYGSWENAFFMPKPCMLQYDGTVAYYLDPNNYAYREDGVTPSDITNDNFNGNAMMEWGQNGKKIWYKIEPIADGRANIFIADHKEDDGFVCYSFIGGSNQELEHFYTPIYNGSNVSSRLRSLSGKRQMVSNSGATEIAYAKANGNGWYIEQWCDRTLINFLLILMGKSLDTQKVFGNGHYSGGSAEGSNLSTGTMNGKGMFWGSNGNDGVKVFGMENWWANTWRRTAGLINNKGTYYVKMTPNTYDGSTITTYDDSGNGAGYVAMGSVPSASQSYIKTYRFNDKCMLPSTMGGASNTYYCDGMWSNNGQVDFALVGGGSNSGAICGAFAVDLSNVLGTAYWSIGASLSYKHS